MSIDKVREYLKEFGAENGIMEFDVSSATVELAAEAVGVEPARIAKSLSFKVEEGCIVVVTAGDMHIDNKKYKAEFKTKAKMLNFEEVEEFTGFRVGGVCPFALPENVDVYLDESLKRFETVFPACGTSNSAIELSCDKLEEYSKPKKWVDVCKISQK